MITRLLVYATQFLDDDRHRQPQATAVFRRPKQRLEGSGVWRDSACRRHHDPPHWPLTPGRCTTFVANLDAVGFDGTRSSSPHRWPRWGVRGRSAGPPRHFTPPPSGLT